MQATILVVEDNRLVRELVSNVLRLEGHEVVEACDGVIALEMLQTLRFDLVITDFVMPKLNGIKFVEQLHTFQPRMPIIFITGYLSVASGAKILDDVAAILAKPFEPDVLRSTVHRVIATTSPRKHPPH